MKKLIFIFLFSVFSLSSFAQNDSVSKPNISVVSNEKLNVVYRGLPNPISISVPGGKPFTATAPGLTKISEGKYNLKPGSGTEIFVMVNIRQDDGSTFIEKHRFRILNIQGFIPAINGNPICPACNLRFTLEELINAEISVDIPRTLYDFKFEVRQFSIKIPRKQTIVIEGNKFDDKVIEALKSIKKNDQIVVYDIKTTLQGSDNIMPAKMGPIIFEIYKTKNIKLKPSKTERDSLRIKRKQEKLIKKKTSQS